MPTVNAIVACPVHDSARVRQAAGMFDVAVEAKAEARFCVEMPDEGEAWTIGAIVGPSGSGKSTIAREAFGSRVARAEAWPADRAVIDGFPDLPTRQITHTLTAVGFSSPPAWLRPYAVLSNGERFRCDLARALLASDGLVVCDEFTSVVDRTVAKVASAAVAKAIRRRRVPARRFVAVSCHYDILDWLEPDWVVDMATCQLARGRLQRPAIRLEVVRCEREAWRLFARHHYLSGRLHVAAQCYLATWDGEPACFAAVLPMMGRKGERRITRIVTLPDYQGVGIGSRVLDVVAGLYWEEGQVMRITTGHPAMRSHLQRAADWRTVSIDRRGHRRHHSRPNVPVSAGRAVASFVYDPQSTQAPAAAPEGKL